MGLSHVCTDTRLNRHLESSTGPLLSCVQQPEGLSESLILTAATSMLCSPSFLPVRAAFSRYSIAYAASSAIFFSKPELIVTF